MEDLFDRLRQPAPPRFVIEGQFKVPSSLSPALQQAFQQYGLDEVEARPDVLWIVPVAELDIDEGDLLGPASHPEFVIFIIDVKMAADPNLRHFVEVAYYGLGLTEALRLDPVLARRYAVHRQAYVWPGTHDHNAFRTLHANAVARGERDPIGTALRDTLVAIPHEVYHDHVLEFFEQRLLPVLGQPATGTAWHVAAKCQLCDYISFCRRQAELNDHLSRLHGLTAGEAELLRQQGLYTTADLAVAIRQDTPAWQAARDLSPRLRAESQALLARAEALQKKHVVVVPDRKTTAMPRWSNMNILLTVHFDPGSGISFALGARYIYFPPDHRPGDPPKTDEVLLVVDRVDRLNPDTERARLRELLEVINGWLQTAHDANEQIRQDRKERGEWDIDYGKVSVHFFVWDPLELRQLKRMIQRHLATADDQFLDQLQSLARLFPPDDQLPDPEAFRSQPGTVVKGVVEHLLGLPEAHTLTLFQTANTLLAQTQDPCDPDPFRYRPKYGFFTDMTDQIPFERAYELWEDRIYLSHSKKKGRRRYRRDEIEEGLRGAMRLRLDALNTVIRYLREQQGDRLLMRKSPFTLATQLPIKGVSEVSMQLMTLHLMDEASQELENYHELAWPVEEREARFISIRGLRPASGTPYDDAIDEVRRTKPRYTGSELRAFTFSPTSRDAKMKEGDFTLALSNEHMDHHLHDPWRLHVFGGLSVTEAKQLLEQFGVQNWTWSLARASIGKLLKVELVYLAPLENPPFLILALSDPVLFQLAENWGLIDFNQPLVLDPIYYDFRTKQVKKVLRAVHGYKA